MAWAVMLEQKQVLMVSFNIWHAVSCSSPIKTSINKLTGITRALSKEVAPFNIRTLTVILGAFNTNMPNVAAQGKVPFPEDYKGSPTEQLIQFIESGKFVPGGDKDKAMKVVYEVVVGEGVGKGREGEKFLPLGPDMTNRVKVVQDYLAHSLEVFGEITDNVNVDK